MRHPARLQCVLILTGMLAELISDTLEDLFTTKSCKNIYLFIFSHLA